MTRRSGGAGPAGEVRGSARWPVHSLPQRRGFWEWIAGLLALRDRNKTLTRYRRRSRWQGRRIWRYNGCSFFPESRWDAERVNARAPSVPRSCRQSWFGRRSLLGVAW